VLYDTAFATAAINDTPNKAGHTTHDTEQGTHAHVAVYYIYSPRLLHALPVMCQQHP